MNSLHLTFFFMLKIMWDLQIIQSIYQSVNVTAFPPEMLSCATNGMLANPNWLAYFTFYLHIRNEIFAWYDTRRRTGNIQIIITSQRLLPKTWSQRHTGLLPATGPTDATINRRYLIRYWVDVFAYAHSDQSVPLCILSCCYYYWLICRLCSSPWITNPWVRLVWQRRTPPESLTKKTCRGERLSRVRLDSSS